MQDQKKLSKMQRLILKTIYDDYKKSPMAWTGKIKPIYKDGKLVDFEPIQNRWRMGALGGVDTLWLSRKISDKMVNKRVIWDRKASEQKEYKKLLKNKRSYENGMISKKEYHKELQISSILTSLWRSDETDHKEWLTASFRASFSRSLRRLQKRGLVKLSSKHHEGKQIKPYVNKITLTSEGEKIAKNIKIKSC